MLRSLLSFTGKRPNYIFREVNPKIDGDDCRNDCQDCTVQCPKNVKIDTVLPMYGFIQGVSHAHPGGHGEDRLDPQGRAGEGQFNGSFQMWYQVLQAWGIFTFLPILFVHKLTSNIAVNGLSIQSHSTRGPRPRLQQDNHNSDSSPPTIVYIRGWRVLLRRQTRSRSIYRQQQQS